MPLAVSPCIDCVLNASSQDNLPPAQSYASNNKPVSKLVVQMQPASQVGGAPRESNSAS
jgi:hypothetical protein